MDTDFQNMASVSKRLFTRWPLDGSYRASLAVQTAAVTFVHRSRNVPACPPVHRSLGDVGVTGSGQMACEGLPISCFCHFCHFCHHWCHRSLGDVGVTGSGQMACEGLPISCFCHWCHFCHHWCHRSFGDVGVTGSGQMACEGLRISCFCQIVPLVW